MPALGLLFHSGNLLLLFTTPSTRTEVSNRQQYRGEKFNLASYTGTSGQLQITVTAKQGLHSSQLLSEESLHRKKVTRR